ncbi:MAG: AzlC family ABC transporter permease [Lentisphaeria bacterium]|nr:AzlC family ABC transporter permease [Lentisphaeria bacterium]
MFSRRVLKSAWVSSIPVLMGYLTMGFAAGVLFAGRVDVPGVAFWAFLTSATSISGALQFLMSEWARTGTPLLDVALLTVCLNLRYAMYGFSLLERFRGLPLMQKLYLIWTLTDETYALEVENRTPPGENPVAYCLAVAAFDHLYWIAGVTAGALAGSGIRFDNRGIDFAMTALFLVILTDQCREKRNRIPALAGILATICCRFFFQPENLLIPSMILMLTVLLALRRPLSRKEDPA